MQSVNKEYIIDITDMSSEGAGIGKIDGFAVFVPFALKGEKVRIIITKMLKNYAIGQLVEVISPSPYRIQPLCRFFYKCGGCDFQHADYRFELLYKTDKVKTALERIGSVKANVLPIIPAVAHENYRNKAKFAVSGGEIGFFKTKSHSIVPVDNCAIQNKITEDITAAIRNIERHISSAVAEVTVRIAENTGEVMICLTTDKKIPDAEKLIQTLCDLNKNIVSIVQIKKDSGKEVLLWGKRYITDKIGDLTFRISPKSFYQVNSKQTKILYDKIVKLSCFSGTERVFDLYCGIGTISLYISRYVREVTGVEIAGEAVKDAKINAKINEINNAFFYEGAAEHAVKSLGKADVVIIDPPRKGCDKSLLDTISEISPDKIIYVSCNPATLARDLKILSGYGFETKIVQPVDMFPRTAHVECVVLMSRAKE
jgi:23S rRNA (uracil1939-C5)-methyltransferase